MVPVRLVASRMYRESPPFRVQPHNDDRLVAAERRLPALVPRRRGSRRAGRGSTLSSIVPVRLVDKSRLFVRIARLLRLLRVAGHREQCQGREGHDGVHAGVLTEFPHGVS